MPNTNCLEGMRCPKCQQEDEFTIDTMSTFTVTDDGAEQTGDVQWQDSDRMQCNECDHVGTVGEFRSMESGATCSQD